MEVLEHILSRSRHTKGRNAIDAVGVLVPATRTARLHRQDRHTVGEEGLLVLQGLLVVERTAGHGDHTDLDALHEFLGLQASGDLGTGSDEDELRLVLTVINDVGALRHSLAIRVSKNRKGLAGESHDHRKLRLHVHRIGTNGLIGIGRSNDRDIRHRTDLLEMFNRLMSGTILTHTNRIVGHDVEDGELLDGTHTNGTHHVASEGEEGGAEGTHATIGVHTIADRAHGVLTNTKVDVATLGMFLAERNRGGDVGVVGGSEIRRTTRDLMIALCKVVEDLARDGTSGDVLLSGLVDGEVLLPSLLELALHAAIQLSTELGVAAAVLLHHLDPSGVLLASLLRSGVVEGVHVLRNSVGLRGGNTELLASGLDAVPADGGTVAGAGALKGTAVANLGANGNDGGPRSHEEEGRERTCQ